MISRLINSTQTLSLTLCRRGTHCRDHPISPGRRGRETSRSNERLTRGRRGSHRLDRGPAGTISHNYSNAEFEPRYNALYCHDCIPTSRSVEPLLHAYPLHALNTFTHITPAPHQHLTSLLPCQQWQYAAARSGLGRPKGQLP